MLSTGHRDCILSLYIPILYNTIEADWKSKLLLAHSACVLYIKLKRPLWIYSFNRHLMLMLSLLPSSTILRLHFNSQSSSLLVAHIFSQLYELFCWILALFLFLSVEQRKTARWQNRIFLISLFSFATQYKHGPPHPPTTPPSPPTADICVRANGSCV